MTKNPLPFPFKKAREKLLSPPAQKHAMTCVKDGQYVNFSGLPDNGVPGIPNWMQLPGTEGEKELKKRCTKLPGAVFVDHNMEIKALECAVPGVDTKACLLEKANAPGTTPEEKSFFLAAANCVGHAPNCPNLIQGDSSSWSMPWWAWVLIVVGVLALALGAWGARRKQTRAMLYY